MKSEKSQNKKSKIIPFLIGILPGFLAGVGIALLTNWAFGELPFGLYICALLGAVAVAAAGIILGIAIHEAGHLVFGLMSGYKFSSYRIFSLMWIKNENNKIKLKRFKISGTGGQCLMSPPDMKDGRLPVMLYNFGGVLTNLIVGLIFIILFFLLLSIKSLAAVMMIMALLNISFALSNGIPMTSGGVDNDAKNAIALRKDTKAMRALWIQMKINEETSRGVSLRDMPDEWFALPSDEEMQNSMVAALAVFAANRLMEEKKFEDADELMAKIIEDDNATIMFYKQMLTCDRIYVELIGECRSEVVENMLNANQKALMKAMKTYPSIIRTEYAYELLLQKDTDKANKLLKYFNGIAKKYPYANEIKNERELINIATEKAEKQE